MKSFHTSSTETKIYRDRSIILWPTGNNLAVSVHFQLENVSPRGPVALSAVQQWVQGHKKKTTKKEKALLTFCHKFGWSTSLGRHDESSSTLWAETLLSPTVLRTKRCWTEQLGIGTAAQRSALPREKGVQMPARPTDVKHTSWPLPRGNFFPITQKKKKKASCLCRVWAFRSTKKYAYSRDESHISFLLAKRVTSFTEWREGKKTLQDRDTLLQIWTLHNAQPTAIKIKINSPWVGSGEAWKSIKKIKEIIRS